MCEPASITLAITAASAAAGVAQQSAQASAQNKYNAKQRENSIIARNQNLSQIEVQKQQVSQQAGEKTFQNDLAAQKALSTAKVSAGENGVSGLSVDSLLGEIEASQMRYNTSVGANLTDNVNALNMQRENVQTSAVNQVSQLKTPQAPDYLGAALKIGGAYSTYQKAKQ
ncbi:hypothetical protein KTQ42_08250|uniref:virion core protein, T7 gp14 family n=1 Tax=Noviherbaspirillum sp. L7-7A TaxID=2850560 RepID=UPI001C2BA9E8|nr:hypothetical protein [Noviherbaspirillum sp. L7-7A]MBV0879292.1 hypothetical protein [Noviherbaspirillum sp. L7-7A]